jgi:hypothetical protein
MIHNKLYKRHHDARLSSMNWYLQGMHNGETDPTLVLFSGEA